MQQIVCEVLVVGAGPAGSLAARVAAEKGINVILLEEHSVPGSPVFCGEGISFDGIIEGGLEPVEPIICHRITTVRIFAPNRKYTDLIFKDITGYNLNRDIFDKTLAENAVNAGAQLDTNTRATSVIKEGDRIIGVQALNGGYKREYRADIVIGADGHSSKIRCTAGLSRHFPDYMSIAQYRLTGITMETPEVNEIYWGNNYAPGGYAYIFPKGSHAANVGAGVRNRHNKPAVEYLKNFIRKDSRFRNAKIESKTGGICPASGRLDQIVMDGLMLVGDAAGQTVPMTGAGIHSGIAAGKIAGRIASKAIQEGNTSTGRLNEYVKEFDKYWGKSIKDSGKVLKMLDKFSDKDLNVIQEVITQQDIMNLTNGINVPSTLARLTTRSPFKLINLIKTALK